MNTVLHWIAGHWLDVVAVLVVVWFLSHQEPGLTINVKACPSEPPTISQHYKI